MPPLNIHILPPTLFATIFLAFGLNALLNPANALSFFALSYPHPDQNSDDKQRTDLLLAAYGIRDIFMAAAIYAAAAFGNRKVLGLITAAAGFVAVADGVLCRVMVGSGEWGHWGYAPVVVAVGGWLVLG